MKNSVAVAVSLCTLLMGGCSTLSPDPLQPSDIMLRAAGDRADAFNNVEPIAGPLSLEEALARALKYNLDNRTRMMEEAIALNQFDVSQYDMLPRLVAAAGYRDRSEYATTRAIDSVTGAPSLANPFISSEKSHSAYDLGLTWSLLDFGLSYYSAKQNADRVLIATERRRKAMHLLIQDVRTAFWRTASAQKLSAEVKSVIALAEAALGDARKAEEERLRSPLDSLRYQRQILENLRLLEMIGQELASARVDLARLINAPLVQTLQVVEPAEMVASRMLDLSVEQMESIAVAQNADLREEFYNTRISSEEARKVILKLFPNLSLNYNLKYDDDKYLVHNSWNEAGAQLSFNLLNLMSVPAQLRMADAGVALADQRRIATQMAILAQVHVARLQYASAYQQFVRADAISSVDEKINQYAVAREQAQVQSKLDQVADSTTAILSLLRRYQALAQLHGASSRLQATLGMEPRIDSVQDLSLSELTGDIRKAVQAWNAGQLPVQEVPAAPAGAE